MKGCRLPLARIQRSRSILSPSSKRPDRYANESSPHDDVVAKDTQLLIDMVVESMPQQRQMIYRMSREQHLKNEEIAQRLGIQKKTVENHLNLALKEIKKALYLMILLPCHWV